MALTPLKAKHHWLQELDPEDGQLGFNTLLIALNFTAGIISLKRMREWGGHRSQIGKIPMFFSFGFFAWGIGTIIWGAHDLFYNIAVPFPGWPDVAYVLINPSFISGVAYFGYTITVKDSNHYSLAKLYLLLIPIVMILVSYYLISTVHFNVGFSSGDHLMTWLNLYYMGGDIIQVLVLILVSSSTHNYLGKRLLVPFVLVVVSILFSYSADTIYAYSTSVGSYVNGGLVDYFYALAIFLLAIGMQVLHPRLLKD